MVIGLSAITYDTDGHRFINQDAGQGIVNRGCARRVARVPTLDGGAVINDGGYSASDRTYVIKTRDDSTAFAEWTERMVQSYATLYLSSEIGFFIGVPNRWWMRNGFLYIEILIVSQED